MSTLNEETKVLPQDTNNHNKECFSNTFEGKVVSVTGNKLVMTNRVGKEYSHTLAMDATLTCDGAVCKAGDLKAGSRIRVTTNKDASNVATCVESLDENDEFEMCC